MDQIYETLISHVRIETLITVLISSAVVFTILAYNSMKFRKELDQFAAIWDDIVEKRDEIIKDLRKKRDVLSKEVSSTITLNGDLLKLNKDLLKEIEELKSAEQIKYLNAFNQIKSKDAQELEKLRMEVRELEQKLTDKEEDEIKYKKIIENLEKVIQILENEKLNLKSRESVLIDGAKNALAEVDKLKTELAEYDASHKTIADFFKDHPKVSKHLDLRSAKTEDLIPETDEPSFSRPMSSGTSTWMASPFD